MEELEADRGTDTMSEDKPGQNGRATDRKLRNLLLDARFQLKFAAYFVG